MNKKIVIVISLLGSFFQNNMASELESRTVKEESGFCIDGLTFSSDGKKIYSYQMGKELPEVQEINFSTGELKTINPDEISITAGHDRISYSFLKFLQEKPIFCFLDEGVLKLFNLEIREKKHLDIVDLRSLKSFSLNSEETYASYVLCDDAQRVVVRNLEREEERVILDSRYLYKVNTTVFSPDSKKIAVAGFEEEGLKIFDAQTGKNLHSFNGYLDWINTIKFSPDGSNIAFGGRNGIKVINAETSEPVSDLEDNERGNVCGIEFSSINPLLIGATAYSIQLWNFLNGTCLKKIPSGKYNMNYFSKIALSPDGNHLVSGSQGGKVKVWDISCINELLEQEVVQEEEA